MGRKCIFFIMWLAYDNCAMKNMKQAAMIEMNSDLYNRLLHGKLIRNMGGFV